MVAGPSPPLPADVLLETFLRADPVTSAAASRARPPPRRALRLLRRRRRRPVGAVHGAATWSCRTRARAEQVARQQSRRRRRGGALAVRVQRRVLPRGLLRRRRRAGGRGQAPAGLPEPRVAHQRRAPRRRRRTYGTRLSVLAADGLSISVWTQQTADGVWARQVVIDVGGVAAEMRPRWPALPRAVGGGERVKLERWFGERSGTAVVEVSGCGHFAVNVATKAMEMVKEFSETRVMWVMCGHEMDPFPLLRKLKPL
ncbi:hypothetical protein ACP4OV_003886 [Aristida adscensionis]